MIRGMFDNGSMPVLERMVQFTESRHKLLAHNIANVSNPYFKPVDASPESFQAALADAVDRRRQSPTPGSGPLRLRDTRSVSFEHDRVSLTGRPTNEGVLYHDENNRDVIRLMQDVAENTLAHNAGVELLRSQFALMRTAIRGRS